MRCCWTRRDRTDGARPAEQVEHREGPQPSHAQPAAAQATPRRRGTSSSSSSGSAGSRRRRRAVSSTNIPFGIWAFVAQMISRSVRAGRSIDLCCDTCDTWYRTAEVGLSVQEAEALDEWHCGVCLGTHQPVSAISLAPAKSGQRGAASPKKRQDFSQVRTRLHPSI